MDDGLPTPKESKNHENNSSKMHDKSKSVVIGEEIEHGEDISPVMSIFTHSTDKWERSITSIRYIKCYIGHILTRPPERKLSSEDAYLVLFEKYYHKDGREEALEKASTEYHHEFSEWHENHMTSFVKNKICSMDKGIHHFFIDSESKKLE